MKEELNLREKDVAERIFFIRGLKVMMDSDLAEVYGVPTKRLNEQVKRNLERFPKDFVFQLTKKELANLRSQIATSSWQKLHGGRRTLPYVFTEHGAVMLASVLKSKQAIEASIFVVRVFVKIRSMIEQLKVLESKISEIQQEAQKRMDLHEEQIKLVFATIKKLITQENPPRELIGFKSFSTQSKPTSTKAK